MSQHPEQVVAHPPLSSVPLLDVLLVGPLSSGVPLLPVLLELFELLGGGFVYVIPPEASSDPLELVLLALLVLDVLIAPDEEPVGSHLPASPGASSPAAHDTATSPTRSGASVPGRLLARVGIR